MVPFQAWLAQLSSNNGWGRLSCSCATFVIFTPRENEAAPALREM